MAKIQNGDRVSVKIDGTVLRVYNDGALAILTDPGKHDAVQGLRLVVSQGALLDHTPRKFQIGDPVTFVPGLGWAGKKFEILHMDGDSAWLRGNDPALGTFRITGKLDELEFVEEFYD